jgi:hypothetical protein
MSRPKQPPSFYTRLSSPGSSPRLQTPSFDRGFLSLFAGLGPGPVTRDALGSDISPDTGDDG